MAIQLSVSARNATLAALTSSSVGTVDSFVVEDGSGFSAAVSYLSIADADAYFSSRNGAIWNAATETQKKAALVLATDYIDLKFGSRFRGEKGSGALEFPRNYAYYNNGVQIIGVPQEIVTATAELAILALQIDLFSSPTTTNGYSTTKTVGSVSENTSIGGNFDYITNAIATAEYPLLALLRYKTVMRG